MKKTFAEIWAEKEIIAFIICGIVCAVSAAMFNRTLETYWLYASVYSVMIALYAGWVAIG